MDLLETECKCGNPDCKAHVHMRKGFVYLTHPDGSQETRSDYFYIDAWSWQKDGAAKSIELMLTPEAAKHLMWNLILGYMPGISHAERMVSRIRRELFIAEDHLSSIKKKFWR